MLSALTYTMSHVNKNRNFIRSKVLHIELEK